MPDRRAPPAPLGTVIVLYQPDHSTIAHVERLADQGFAPIAVVNAADEPHRARLRANSDVVVIENRGNEGLARAFNQGIDAALARGDGYVLLFDQDSRPPEGFAVGLLDAAHRAEALGPLGCIGPVIVDRKRPYARATHPGRPLAPGLAQVSTLISSGMLIPRASIEQVGGMWRELFIDAVDHEWCFRANKAGLAIVLATDIVLPHDMGDDGLTLLGRYKPVHRSPVRHYHIVRNTLWLARCSFIPRRWRLTETLKLALRAPAYLLFSSARGDTLRSLWRGLRDGLGSAPGRTLRG